MKKTEINPTVVCVCVLTDPSVPQEKFTRTDRTFTQTLSHAHTHISKSQSLRPPLFSKSQDFIFRLLVTEKPTINNTHSCSGRSLKLFSITDYIFYLHTEHCQCRDNSSLQTLTDVHLSAAILCSFLSAGNVFFLLQLWTSKLSI